MAESPPLSPSPQKRRSSRLMRFILVVFVFALVGFTIWYLYPASTQQEQVQQEHTHKHGDGQQASGQANGDGGGSHHGSGKFDPNAAMPVAVVTIRKGDIDILRRGLGTVTPLANITIRTQINGQLMEVAFQEGQIVHQGDFLAQIDPRPYQIALEQATGALQRDQALLSEAKIDLARYEKLWAQNSVSKQTLDAQVSLVQQDEGNVLTDQSQIDSAKLNLTYAHITAPVTGRVGLRQVDAGNYVQTSDTNGLVVLTQIQPITAIFTLPEDDVPAVTKLYNDGAELLATAYDRANSAKLATGRLTAVDNQINTSTGTFQLRAQFDNQDNALFPNQFVNVELKLSTQHDATLAPTVAIQRGTSGTFVYKLKDDNTVTVQTVKLGATQGDVVEILDGLAPDDKVVTEGVDKLRDGARVTVK